MLRYAAQAPGALLVLRHLHPPSTRSQWKLPQKKHQQWPTFTLHMGSQGLLLNSLPSVTNTFIGLLLVDIENISFVRNYAMSIVYVFEMCFILEASVVVFLLTVIIFFKMFFNVLFHIKLRG